MALGNAVNSSEMTITGVLTSAQIKALHGTPIQVVAAPGVGTITRIIRVAFRMVYGGSNIFVAGAGQTINVQYSTTTVGVIGFTNADIVVAFNRVNFPAVPAVDTGPSNYDNLALNLYNPSATEITGNAANDNTITYNITFQYVSV